MEFLGGNYRKEINFPIMSNYSLLSLTEIKEIFDEKGIPFDKPGFCDHPNFAKVEEKDPEFLNIYARFVSLISDNKKYKKFARSIIDSSSVLFLRAIKRNGRLGACIDASCTFSKMLDQLGIWNFVVKGAFTLQYQNKPHLPPIYFWPLDTNTKAAAGHVWIYAPPYYILDLTITLQPYDSPEYLESIPDYIKEEFGLPYQPKVNDLCSPEIKRYWLRNGFCPSSIEELYLSGALQKDFLKAFPARRINFGKAHGSFIPVATGGYNCSLEEIKTISFEGLQASEFFNKNIKPHFV